MLSTLQTMLRTKCARRLPTEAMKPNGIVEKLNHGLNTSLKNLQIQLGNVVSNPDVYFDYKNTSDVRNTCRFPTRQDIFILRMHHDACEFVVELFKMEPFYSDSNYVKIEKSIKPNTELTPNFVEEKVRLLTKDKDSGSFDDEEGNATNGAKNGININIDTTLQLELIVKPDHTVATLGECLDQFLQEQIVQSSEKALKENKTENIEKHGYRKIYSIYDWPKLLVICLKRFDHLGNKISTPIDVSEVFKREDTCYKLHGIVHHSGNLSGGHYIAYVYSNELKQWVCYNDNNVSSRGQYASFKDSINTNQYILVYQKVDACGLLHGIPPPTASPPKPPPPAPPRALPPQAPPAGPTSTVEVEFCRDPIVSDPVPSTALALPEIPWDRNLPNPKISVRGLANDCWFNSVFQIMVRTPIAKQIVDSDEVYSDPVLKTIKAELVKLFTKPNYFVVTGEQGCSIFRTTFQDSDKKPRNRIGSPETDNYFLTYLRDIEPFKSNTKYEEAYSYEIEDDFYPYYTKHGGDTSPEYVLNVQAYLINHSFHEGKDMYILKIDGQKMYFENVPSSFHTKDGYSYDLFGFTIDLNQHFGAGVKNLNNNRWYYFDDTLRTKPTDCQNLTSTRDESTNTEVLSFASLEDLVQCKDTGVLSNTLGQHIKPVDARKTLVYIKTSKHLRVTHGEEYKKSEIPLSRPVLQEIPWDRNLPNPMITGVDGSPQCANDCWFNSVLQIVLRLYFAKNVLNYGPITKEANLNFEFLNKVRQEFSKMFTERAYFLATSKTCQNVGEARCALISQEFKFGESSEDAVFLNYILEIEPFKSQSMFKLEGQSHENNIYQVGITEDIPENNSDDDFKQFDINVHNILTKIPFANYPNLFVFAIGRTYLVKTKIPHQFVNKNVSYTLFGFTSLVGKTFGGGHYIACVKRPSNNLWYYYDDVSDEGVETTANLSEFEKRETIWSTYDYDTGEKSDNRTILFYLKDPQDPLPAALTKRIVPIQEVDDDGVHWGEVELDENDG